MLELSLNEIPKELYPQPMLKPNFQIQELTKIRKDISRSLKVTEKVRMKSLNSNDQVIRSIKVHSPKQKFKQFRVTEQITAKPIQTQSAINIDTQELFKEYLDQEKTFQIKQDSMQQMLREKLYMSYCNTLRQQKRPKMEIKNKMETLTPYIPESIRFKTPRTKRQELLMRKLRSSSNPKKIESGTVSIRKLNASATENRTLHTQQEELLIKLPTLKESYEHSKIIKRINRQTELARQGYPKLNPQPVLQIQQQLLDIVPLRNSTKQRMIESFNEIMRFY